jgi:NADPH-dependent F420 reductase
MMLGHTHRATTGSPTVTEPLSIAVIGGTGPQGKGLALRFARAGHRVALGSRDAARAAEAAMEVNAQLGSGAELTGATNADAAAGADVVLLAVPWNGHGELVAGLAEQLAGKVVISCVNPLGFDKRGPYGLEVKESAAEEAQALVPTAKVVGAFHHLSAVSLWEEQGLLDHEDVLVVSDDADAKALVLDLAATVTGRAGIDAGALRLARQLEPLTAVLIAINKKYKVRSGVHIAGLDRPSS